MTKKEATVVCIKPIVKKTAKIRIIGDSPLIVHAWSEKAKRMMLEKQMKKAAADLNFEAAAGLRDRMVDLKGKLRDFDR